MASRFGIPTSPALHTCGSAWSTGIDVELAAHLTCTKRSSRCSWQYIYESLLGRTRCCLAWLPARWLRAGVDQPLTRRMVGRVLDMSGEDLAISGDNVHIHISEATLRADHVLELVCTDGVMVELTFPRQWAQSEGSHYQERSWSATAKAKWLRQRFRLQGKPRRTARSPRPSSPSNARGMNSYGYRLASCS